MRQDFEHRDSGVRSFPQVLGLSSKSQATVKPHLQVLMTTNYFELVPPEEEWVFRGPQSEGQTFVFFKIDP